MIGWIVAIVRRPGVRLLMGTAKEIFKPDIEAIKSRISSAFSRVSNYICMSEELPRINHFDQDIQEIIRQKISAFTIACAQ